MTIDPAKLPAHAVEAARKAVADRELHYADSSPTAPTIIAAFLKALLADDGAIDRLHAAAWDFGMAGDDDHERARYRAAITAACQEDPA